MLKRIYLAITLTLLLTGFSFCPAQAEEGNKLQRLLEITGLPSELSGVVNGTPVSLRARLDRDMLVYGLPSDVPNNDWKTAPTSWERDNSINLGHPGNQEPRYLGYTWNGEDLFASDYFPDDASNQISPAKRDMVKWPWRKGMAVGGNKDISDYSWGVIIKALQTYHKRIGFEGDENSFANNPAFYGDFERVKDYFKVLADPRPGMAGAVRHWHNRTDLGGVWYDTIFVRWDILPNFTVESIDPGTDKARPGETYTGRVVIKARPDASFMSDPVTGRLFDAMGIKMELSQDYAVPLGVAVNGRLIPLQNFQPVAGLDNVFQYSVPAGTVENKQEFTFQWSLPEGLAGDKVSLAAGVNESIKVLPQDVWRYMDWSEITNADNVKTVEVPADLPNLRVTGIALTPDSGLPGRPVSGLVTVQNDTGRAFSATNTVWKARRPDGTVLDEGTITTDLGPEESRQLPFNFTPDVEGVYAVAAMINPGHDNPPDEINYLRGDWPGDNRMEVTYRAGQACTDVSVTLARKGAGDIYPGYAVNLAAVVSRADDGPEGPVDITVRLFDGRESYTRKVALAKGRTEQVLFTVESGDPGSYAYTVTAMLVGVEDCSPGNNSAGCTIDVVKPYQPEPADSGIETDITGGGGLYRQW
jgi:hypothetical protein